MNNKWSKKEVQSALDLIQNGKNYKEIAQIICRSHQSVKGKLRNLNETYKKYNDDNCEQKYICFQCKKEFVDLKSRNRKFCSRSCAVKYNNKKRKTIKYCLFCGNEISSKKNKIQKFCTAICAGKYKSKKHYDNYLSNQDDYTNKIISIKSLKPHILNEQKYRCAICDIKNIWNNKKLIFILDHINGDAANNRRNNLRLICSNCDSQLPTYKSKNKNSARKNRYLLNYL